MPKKLTYMFVNSEFSKEGFVLLSEDYINNYSPLDYRCPNGHIYRIRWQDWKKGYRCPFCREGGNTVKLSERLEEVKCRFELEGYVLLTGAVVNSRDVVEIMCPKNHRFSMVLKNWLSGNRCPVCSNRQPLKYRINEIKESLYNAGYIFVEILNRKIVYICDNNHKHSVLWTDWQRGVRCPYCYGNNRKSFDEIKELFARENYVICSGEYNNCYTKLEYVCPLGHSGSVTWNDWQQGCRCSTCANISNSIRVSGPGHPNWKGGISCEPYCSDWTKEYKEHIKERDGNKCLNPDCWHKDNALTIHHIDYNKKNCRPDNLITVCRSCNSRANKNRVWHKAWYRTILYRRYKYDTY